MEIKLIGKMNNRLQINYTGGEIIRTKEDFEILEENLLFQHSSLLIPQIVKQNYQRWFETIFDFNKEAAMKNSIIDNFLKNEKYYLTANSNKIMKNVYSYLEKLDYLWTQNVEYHKWANKCGQFRGQRNGGNAKCVGEEVSGVQRDCGGHSLEAEGTDCEVQQVAQTEWGLHAQFRVPFG